MKWLFEFSDQPLNIFAPIVGTQYLSNGVKRGPFYFSIDDFVKAFDSEDSSIYDPEGLRVKEVSTPALPFGTIRYSSTEDEERHRITMEIPKKQWEICYQEQNNFYSIGFPRMIIQYVVTKTTDSILKIIETRLFSVLNDGNPIEDDTLLYAFPYPNVGKQNGIVCWGANQRFEINNLVELERMFRWFVSAPFNEDHGVRTTHGMHHFHKLLQIIQDKPFDDDWLVPLNKTFGDLFN